MLEKPTDLGLRRNIGVEGHEKGSIRMEMQDGASKDATVGSARRRGEAENEL